MGVRRWSTVGSKRSSNGKVARLSAALPTSYSQGDSRRVSRERHEGGRGRPGHRVRGTSTQLAGVAYSETSARSCRARLAPPMSWHAWAETSSASSSWAWTRLGQSSSSAGSCSSSMSGCVPGTGRSASVSGRQPARGGSHHQTSRRDMPTRSCTSRRRTAATRSSSGRFPEPPPALGEWQ